MTATVPLASSTGTPARRIGVLLPSSNTTVEEEIGSALSAFGRCHYQRFARTIRDEDEVEECHQSVLEAAVAIAPLKLTALGVAYTSASFVAGAAWDLRLRDDLTAACGCTAVTAASALVGALGAMRVRAVAVVSPYPEMVNRRIPDFLATADIDTVAVGGGPQGRPASLLSEPEIIELALSVDRVGAQALVLCCTALRTAAVVERIEQTIGLPVVTSNSALTSALVRQTGSGSAPVGRWPR